MEMEMEEVEVKVEVKAGIVKPFLPLEFVRWKEKEEGGREGGREVGRFSLSSSLDHSNCERHGAAGRDVCVCCAKVLLMEYLGYICQLS